jgi:hypothetical protein
MRDVPLAELLLCCICSKANSHASWFMSVHDTLTFDGLVARAEIRF